LVIGASATSTSLLKNLVLPGIGHFTILDPNDTKPEDVGNNFFLEVDSIGKQKAVEAARLLSELNTSVQSAAEIAVSQTLLEKLDVVTDAIGFIDRMWRIFSKRGQNGSQTILSYLPTIYLARR
jgi:molybdopterin/thiamine biosynthesis adenylyltransferase